MCIPQIRQQAPSGKMGWWQVTLAHLEDSSRHTRWSSCNNRSCEIVVQYFCRCMTWVGARWFIVDLDLIFFRMFVRFSCWIRKQEKVSVEIDEEWSIVLHCVEETYESGLVSACTSGDVIAQLVGDGDPRAVVAVPYKLFAPEWAFEEFRKCIRCVLLQRADISIQ